MQAHFDWFYMPYKFFWLGFLSWNDEFDKIVFTLDQLNQWISFLIYFLFGPFLIEILITLSVFLVGLNIVALYFD